MTRAPNHSPAGRTRVRPALSGFTRYAVIPLALLCSGVLVGMRVERALLSRGETAAVAPREARPAPARPTPALARPSLEVTGSFQNNIFPSLLLSFGTAHPEYTRCITVALSGLPATGDLRLRVDSELFLRPLQLPLSPEAGAATLNPELPWNYDLLRRVSQLRPQSFVAEVLQDGRSLGEATLVCTVHSVNEAVARIYVQSTGQWQDTSVCFAAFVNEDHPWINALLQEAQEGSGLRAFNGYQSGPMAAMQQVQAVWDALASKGLSYVNLATDSGASPFVATQYVRFLDQSVRDHGANCVDASVLFASILRRIGLRPVLLFRPGHCFVGYYDAEEGGRLVAFETTLLGSVSFPSAAAEGARELQTILPMVGSVQYSIVDIGLCRQQGISPISFRQDDSG